MRSSTVHEESGAGNFLGSKCCIPNYWNQSHLIMNRVCHFSKIRGNSGANFPFLCTNKVHKQSFTPRWMSTYFYIQDSWYKTIKFINILTLAQVAKARQAGHKKHQSDAHWGFPTGRSCVVKVERLSFWKPTFHQSFKIFCYVSIINCNWLPYLGSKKIWYSEKYDIGYERVFENLTLGIHLDMW